MTDTGPELARRLGTTDAVVIGLGSMIGAGVFSAFAPAAAAAGAGLMIGLGVAAVVAYCNATASAQLAATYPTSGGTYIYGRERLGPWWGFLAGWGFVIGKTASCAAMALTFAAYAVPVAWQRPVAVAAVVALAAVNYRGVTRTAGSPGSSSWWSWPPWLSSPPPASLAGRPTSPDWQRSPALKGVCTGYCSPQACCSSPSPVTPESPQWVRRSATRSERSPERSHSPWGSPSPSTPSSGRQRY